MIALETRNARKTFRSLRGRRSVALAGVDLEVHRGEIVGLVGPNGAGKSTLLLAAAGLLRLDAGTVAHSGPSAASAAIGYAPERVAYHQDETCEEVLTTLALARGARWGSAGDQVRRVIEELALQEHVHKRVGALSRGLVQRLGLAQALLGDPDLLLLDETLSGVDPVVHNQICAVLSRLPSRGTAVVLSSHDLSAVEELATRVVVLSGGRVRGVLARREYSRPGTLRARFLELVGAGDDWRTRATAG